MIKGTGKLAPFGLRMEPQLKDQVRKASEKARWSINTWIVEAIEEKLKREQKEAEV